MSILFIGSVFRILNLLSHTVCKGKGGPLLSPWVPKRRILRWLKIHGCCVSPTSLASREIVGRIAVRGQTSALENEEPLCLCQKGHQGNRVRLNKCFTLSGLQLTHSYVNEGLKLDNRFISKFSLK